MSDQEPKRGNFATREGEVILRDHVYDGIQEYDQKLPNWWLFTFFGAIVFFVAFWFYYFNTSWAKSPQQVVNDKVVAIQQQRLEDLARTMAELTDSSLVHSEKWQAQIPHGKTVYVTHCQQCHEKDYTGERFDAMLGKKVSAGGRSMVDGKWEHGGKPKDLFNLINNGTPADKPGLNGAKMEPWGQKLSPVDIASVVAFIISELNRLGLPDFKDIPKEEPAK